MKGYLIVVNANFPFGAELAAADARKLSKKPIKYVLTLLITATTRMATPLGES
jgi:hypothetical protein